MKQISSFVRITGIFCVFIFILSGCSLKRLSFYHQESQEERLNKLIYALENGPSWQHSSIIKSLGEIGDERAVMPLINVLDEFHKGNYATQALLRINSEKTVPILLELLKNKKSKKAGIIYALGEIRDRRAVEPLIQELINEKNSTSIRKVAAEALGNIGDERAIGPLVVMLFDIEYGITDKTFRSLWPAIDSYYTVKMMYIYRGRQQAAASALKKLGWNPDKPEEALRYRLELGCKMAELGLSLLLEKIEKREIGDEEGAVKTFIQLKDKRIVPFLLKELEGISSRWAMASLGYIGDERAIKPLLQIAKDKRDFYLRPPRQACAVEALGNMGAAAKSVLPELEELAINCEDEYTRKKAEEAVVKIQKESPGTSN